VLLVSTVYSVLYSGIALSRKPLGIGHMYIYTFFLLRMTETMNSQNINLSPGTACTFLFWLIIPCSLARVTEVSEDPAAFIFSAEFHNHCLYLSLAAVRY
jgi:hypothetical protein